MSAVASVDVSSFQSPELVMGGVYHSLAEYALASPSLNGLILQKPIV